MKKKPLLVNDHDKLYGVFVNVLAAYAGFCNSRGVNLDTSDSFCMLVWPSVLKVPYHMINIKLSETRSKNTYLQDIGSSLRERFKRDSLEDVVEHKENRKFIDKLSESTGVGLNYQVKAMYAYGIGYFVGWITNY